MTTIIHKIRIYSEEGNPAHPAEIEVTMDGGLPDCPLTFWIDGKAVFSMGCGEVHEFCEQIQKLDVT